MDRVAKSNSGFQCSSNNGLWSIRQGNADVLRHLRAERDILIKHNGLITIITAAPHDDYGHLAEGDRLMAYGLYRLELNDELRAGSGADRGVFLNEAYGNTTHGNNDPATDDYIGLYPKFNGVSCRYIIGAEGLPELKGDGGASLYGNDVVTCSAGHAA